MSFAMQPQQPAGGTLQAAGMGAVGAVQDPLNLASSLQSLIDWLKFFFWALVALFILALLWMAFSGSH